MLFICIDQKEMKTPLQKSEVASDEQPQPSSSSTKTGKGVYVAFKFTVALRRKPLPTVTETLTMFFQKERSILIVAGARE